MSENKTHFTAPQSPHLHSLHPVPHQWKQHLLQDPCVVVHGPFLQLVHSRQNTKKNRFHITISFLCELKKFMK